MQCKESVSKFARLLQSVCWLLWPSLLPFSRTDTTKQPSGRVLHCDLTEKLHLTVSLTCAAGRGTEHTEHNGPLYLSGLLCTVWDFPAPGFEPRMIWMGLGSPAHLFACCQAETGDELSLPLWASLPIIGFARGDGRRIENVYRFLRRDLMLCQVFGHALWSLFWAHPGSHGPWCHLARAWLTQRWGGAHDMGPAQQTNG